MADDSDQASPLVDKETDFLVRKKQEEFKAAPINLTGECEDCGAEIDPRRLEAYPTAARCIGCQTVHEHTEKRYA